MMLKKIELNERISTSNKPTESKKNGKTPSSTNTVIEKLKLMSKSFESEASVDSMSQSDLIESILDIKRIIVKFPMSEKKSIVDINILLSMYEKGLLSHDELSELIHSSFGIRLHDSKPMSPVGLLNSNLFFQIDTMVDVLKVDGIKKRDFLKVIELIVKDNIAIETGELLKYYFKLFESDKVTSRQFSNLVKSMLKQPEIASGVTGDTGDTGDTDDNKNKNNKKNNKNNDYKTKLKLKETSKIFGKKLIK